MSSDMILKVQIWGIKLGIYQIKVKVETHALLKNMPGKNHTKMLGAELSTITEYLMTGETNEEVFILLLCFLNRTDF